MSSYVKEGRYPLTQEDIRRENPRVSLPADIPDWMAAEYGYQSVFELPRPALQPGEVAETWAAPQREVIGVVTEAEATHPITKEVDQTLIGRQLYGNRWVIGWTVRPMTATEIAALRPEMTVSRLTGRLVLGEQVCAQLDAVANDAETPWAMRQTIAYAQTWRRMSEEIDEIGYLLGFDEEQKDTLFLQAMALDRQRSTTAPMA
ncbi:MAG: hypothetical protein AAF755_10420 [Pseudomonadota bacterium]